MKLVCFKTYLNETRATITDFHTAVNKARGIQNLSTQSLEHYMRGRKFNDRVYQECWRELVRRNNAKKAENKKQAERTTGTTNVVLGGSSIRVPFSFLKSNEPQSFCYLWAYDDKPDECKFGDTWVKAGEDPVQACFDRVYDQLGTSKFRLTGRKLAVDPKTGKRNVNIPPDIHVHGIFNVTDLAKKVDRYREHGQMDVAITSDEDSGMPPRIMDQTGKKSDWYSIPWQDAKENLDKFLRDKLGPPKEAQLSVWQATQLDNVLGAMSGGKKTILADLCPRFGKTLWAASIPLEKKIPLTIVSSYVLSSLSSFANQIAKFKQFKNFEIVDTANSNYDDKIKDALANGKQVIALLSLNPSKYRDEKIKKLLGKSLSSDEKLLIVDEADYGAHQINQALPLQKARQKDTTVILMTGTNAERAIGKVYDDDNEIVAAQWKVDHTLSTVYPELEVISQNNISHTPLDHVKVMTKVNDEWSKNVVPMQAVQLPLGRFMEENKKRKEQDTFTNEYNAMEEAQWSKFAQDPVKGRIFFKRLLQALFLGEHGVPELDIENVVDKINNKNSQAQNKVKRDPLVRAMMFLPGSTTTNKDNNNLEKIAKITENALGDKWTIITVSGNETNNAKAENYVKKRIHEADRAGSHVLILSRGMAARSFSVPDITELYIAYDRGEIGATTQKMSRVFTASLDKPNKIGRIFNLSFDPNRDDKFDDYYMKAAQNMTNRPNGQSFAQNLRVVMKTNDFLVSQENGVVKVDADTHTKDLIGHNRLHKIIGRLSTFEDAVTKLGRSVLSSVLNAGIKSPNPSKLDKASKGKTWIGKLIRNVRKQKQGTDTERKQWQHLIESVSYNLRHVIPTVKMKTGKKYTLEKALDIAFDDDKICQMLTNKFGYNFQKVYALYKSGVIDKNLASLYEDE